MSKKIVGACFWLIGRAIEVIVLTVAFVSGAILLYLNDIQFIPFRYTGF